MPRLWKRGSRRRFEYRNSAARFAGAGLFHFYRLLAADAPPYHAARPLRFAVRQHGEPPPAPVGIADVPPPFLHGPREAIDLMRELRDLTRRQTGDTGRIAECVRIIREETKRQTELLGLIEREQAIENRAHHDRDRP